MTKTHPDTSNPTIVIKHTHPTGVSLFENQGKNSENAGKRRYRVCVLLLLLIV